MTQSRPWLRVRWLMVMVAAIAITWVGIMSGVIWSGLRVIWGDATIFPVPTPMDLLRFWVFVGWWVALVTVIVGLLVCDRLKASSDQEGRWKWRITQGMITLISVVITIGTITYAGCELRSTQFDQLAKKYHDLSVRDSPKATPAGDPVKFQFYSKLFDKYSAAGATPWRPVAPDPPEPR